MMAKISLDLILSTDNLNDFMYIIKQYPTANAEENKELFLRYQKGDQDAYEELILKNLRLVVFATKKYKNKTKSMQYIDIIQEGILGMIEAINHYDQEKGAFSTYVIRTIENEVARAIGYTDEMVRRPMYFEETKDKYYNLISSYEKAGKPIPDDDELLKILGITGETLKRIKEDYKLSPKSMDSKMSSDDEDADEYSYFMGTEDAGYDEILNTMVDKELLAYLKLTLTPMEYYVLYYRVLVPKEEQRTFEEISKAFNVSNENIHDRINQLLKKLKRIYPTFKTKIAAIRNDFDIDNINIAPYNPKDFIKYMFVMDCLSTKEKNLYVMWIKRIYTYDEKYYAKKMGISSQEVLNLACSIKEKVAELIALNKDTYEHFKEQISIKYKAKLFAVDLDDLQIAKNSKKLAKVMDLDELDYEKAMQILGEKELPFKTKNLIELYFSKGLETMTQEQLEREINAIKYRFKRERNLPLSVLYKTLIRHKDEFSESDYLYLMSHVFNRIKKSEFKKKYPNVTKYKHLLIFKLELLYYGIENYRNHRMTKEKYLKIRSKALEELDKEDIELLDDLYGFNRQAQDIGKIATRLNISYEKTIQKLRIIKDRITRIYLKGNPVKTVSKDEYIEYLNDERITLTETNRTIALLSIRDGFSNKEIAKRYDLTVQQVATRILDTLRQIDFYRYGILKIDDKYTVEEKMQALESLDLDDTERKIGIELVTSKNYRQTALEFNCPLSRVKSIAKKIFNKAYMMKIEKVEVTEKDIIDELSLHPSETILREEEIQVLSLIYGFKNNYNLKGIKYSNIEIQKMLKMSVPRFHGLKKSGIESVAARKIGLITPTLCYMKRSEVSKILEDLKLPISDKERIYLEAFYGLGGMPRMQLKEMQSIYGDSHNSIARRIQRAFLTIFKYQNGEVAGKKSFELDVEPYLKYFSKLDQEIIIYRFKEGLSAQAISKKVGLTCFQIQGILEKIEPLLIDYQNGYAKGYDFDYFWNHVDDEDIPFYGNKNLAKQMVYLYYEKRYSYSQIKEEINLDLNQTTIATNIFNLMLAVRKKQDGFRKAKEFSYEEIRDYYLNHQSDMTFSHKIYYYRYFNRMQNRGIDNPWIFAQNTSWAIIFDLIKARRENYISIKNLSKEEAIMIARKYYRHMSKDTKEAFLYFTGLKGSDIMDKKDKQKVASIVFNSYEKQPGQIINMN